MALPTQKQLEAEMVALDSRRRATAALLSAMREYEATVSTLNEVAAPVSATGKGRRAAPAMEATERVAAELMERAGGPITTIQVVAEMQSRGIELPTNKTNNVISARLSNSNKFKGKRGHGYWFANRPWPSDNLNSLLADPVETGSQEGNETDT